MQSSHSPIPILNVLTQDNFTSSEILEAISLEPPLNKEYPLSTVKSISRSIKQRSISIIESILRQLSCKSKFPCFSYSLRQLLILYHLSILNNPNYCTNALTFISHVIGKIHLYSIIKIKGENSIQIYDAVVYLFKILPDLFAVLLEKGQFPLIFEAVGSLADTILNSISLVFFWLFIQSFKSKISLSSKANFNQILSKVIKNKECLAFIQKASNDTQRKLCLDYLVILRQSEDELSKYYFSLSNSRLVKEPDTTYNWPTAIKQAYSTKPTTNPFNLNSKNFKEVYENLLFLETFCSSPNIDILEDYVTGGEFDVFIRFIKADPFVDEGYKSKLMKWIETMRELQRNYTDKKRIKQIKEDVVSLAN